MFKLGLVVNPFAGIGGSVALKGSDGLETRTLALKKGALPFADKRATYALEAITDKHKAEIKVLTASGDMGESIAKALGFTTETLLHIEQPSSAEDTHQLVRALAEQDVDMILFAGGDGTARDVASALEKDIPVLGVPAGCKIHSGVYAVTPIAAGKVIEQLISGSVLSLTEASVMDIDEEAFRNGIVKARQFASLSIPQSLQYVQATKQGGQEVEELVLQDIAADVIEKMEPEIVYAIGSGSTCAVIMEQLGLENTLLGIDLIQDGQLLTSDVTEAELLRIAHEGEDLEIVITLIGGQGHLLGRGNQQISAELIKTIGWEQVTVVATKQKLTALEGRPLIIDSGDPELDERLTGSKTIVTGYHDAVIYRVGWGPSDQSS